MKIVQVAAPTTAGGLERVVEALSIGLHRRGHDVTVATLLFEADDAHPFVEMLAGAGVPVHPIHLSPRAYLRERRELGRLFDAVQPDVVHTHGYRIDLLDRGVAARRRIPTVTTVHGASKMGGWKGAFFEWLQRRNYRRFDAVVAVSTPLRTETLRDGVEPARLHMIPNAWSGLRTAVPRDEARRVLGLASDDAVIGWVGRLIHVKGADVFVDAIRRLPEPRPTAVIIGYGPEAERIRRRASEQGVAANVRFYDEIRDAARYFSAFDTYVLSSRSEGLPIVVLEAIATGTPVVATAVGGIPDALGDEEAWLVPSEEPEALARAIAESLENRDAALERARRASRRLETDFSLERWLDRHELVYQHIVNP